MRISLTIIQFVSSTTGVGDNGYEIMVCERGVDLGGIGDIQLSEVVGRARAGALSVIVASEADQVSRL